VLKARPGLQAIAAGMRLPGAALAPRRRCARGALLAWTLLRQGLATGSQQQQTLSGTAAPDACGGAHPRQGLLAVGFTLESEDSAVIEALRARVVSLERALASHFGYEAVRIAGVDAAGFGSASPENVSSAQLFLLRFEACSPLLRPSSAGVGAGTDEDQLRELLEELLNDGEPRWSVADVSVDWEEGGGAVAEPVADGSSSAALTVSGGAMAVLGVATVSWAFHRRKRRRAECEDGSKGGVDIESNTGNLSMDIPKVVDKQLVSVVAYEGTLSALKEGASLHLAPDAAVTPPTELRPNASGGEPAQQGPRPEVARARAAAAEDARVDTGTAAELSETSGLYSL